MNEHILQIKSHNLDRKVDANLDALIQEIGKGNVVPIIGSDMIKVKLGNECYDLMDYILVKLEEQYHESRELKFSYNEKLQLSAKEKLNHIHSYVTKEKLGFYTYIKDIMEKTEGSCDTNSFDQLAKIRKFKLLINASFTNLVEQSVANNRPLISSKVDVFSLNITDTPLQDIEIEPSLNSISPVLSPRKLKKTVVYNLYGKYEWRENSFIVVDDDILELVHTINTNKDKLKTLYELLSASSLLFIGCNFPDWLLRFFIRMFSNQKLSTSNSLYSVADILNESLDRNRAIFISNSTIKYFDFNGNEFVNKLYNKIKQIEPKWIRNNKDQNYIFLSYSSDNQAKVIEIYEKLDDNDFDIFMDIRTIDFGEDISDAVKEAIDNCKIFIPVITNETNTSTSSARFFRKEWEYALDLNEKTNPKNETSKKNIILPLFLNSIKVNELKDTTPSRFFELKYQGIKAENGLPSSFINRIKDILQ
jgi:hypothetical protein